ncbi:MAG: peptidylprolyl isomerase [Pseudomonadota bacterium]
MTLRLLSLCIALLLPASASAQSFVPAVTVNGDIITEYEIEQRFLLLQALRVPGASLIVAEDAMIEDRLKMQAASSAGVEITQDDLEVAFEEFAQRGNLTTFEFLDAIAESGVDVQTFRDFVEAGLAWRAFVRGAFGPRSGISEAELDRAIALSATRSGARVLLAEIVLPTQSAELEAQARAIAEDIRERVQTQADFAEAARRFSIAPTRANGGQRDWVNLSELPPQIASNLLTLAPGETSEVFPISNEAIAIFQVRALEERRAQVPGAVSVEYALLALPNDPNEAAARTAELIGRVDTCDDLYTVAREMPDGALVRETVATGSLPRSVANAIPALDANEGTQIATSAGPRFLMLCARVSAVVEEAGIDQVRNQLRGQRISSYAESYLEELRADAKIVR